MSSATQTTASPRPPRGKHQRSRSGNLPTTNNNETRGGRRPRGNRAHRGHNTVAQSNSVDQQPQDPSLTHNAADELAGPTGPRNSKKHSQPSVQRTPSSGIASTSLTDTDTAISHSATTPAKTQAAYAGPTFHASPAPSTLPIPKFLSKSVPAKTRVGPPTPPPDDDSDSGSSPTPSPSRQPLPIRSRHQDSPLNMLFEADRAERARNPNASPASTMFKSPDQIAVDARPNHARHDSYSSHSAPFAIELDGDSKTSRVSPPVPSPVAHRPVTVPSDPPQNRSTTLPNEGADAINNLLSRLSMSQKIPTDRSPPHHMPSDSALRNHTPPSHGGQSLFRSTSGPATPTPAVPQDDPNFFYGNRNLSPMFKAVSKNPDDPKRNSGLRTEITADSPLMPQGAFSLMPSVNIDGNGAGSRAIMGNALNSTPNARRGSAPHIQPNPQSYRGSPNQHLRRATRTNTPPAPSPKTNNMMAFIPSSVRAKPKLQATTPPPKLPPSNNLALEEDLRRMLNLGMSSNGTESH
ncbi:hypothetical protein DM02DRAFT_589006 [Periconia macrospinosa]|uniref:Uncharacterized protein n=1 Tax=Periconia macrospinosa TaxID=97972 RepID=A0A2V1DXI8_9PLEO|nr:hypothetical protein DM02DRAFT_589006 [Periconia macrospinosa]